jgi:hypothetical protein
MPAVKPFERQCKATGIRIQNQNSSFEKCSGMQDFQDTDCIGKRLQDTLISLTLAVE